MSRLEQAENKMESKGGQLFMKLFLAVMLMLIAALLATLQMTAASGVSAAQHAEAVAEAARADNGKQDQRLAIAEIRIEDERAKTAAVVQTLQALTLEVTQHGDSIQANKDAIKRNHPGRAE